MSVPLSNPALYSFWDTLLHGQYDTGVLHGGRSSSKTRDTAINLIRLVDHVGVRMRILCVRRFQNRITESVYTELKFAIEHLGLSDRFEVQKSTIIHRVSKAEFVFYGIERNIGEIRVRQISISFGLRKPKSSLRINGQLLRRRSVRKTA